MREKSWNLRVCKKQQFTILERDKLREFLERERERVRNGEPRSRRRCRSQRRSQRRCGGPGISAQPFSLSVSRFFSVTLWLWNLVETFFIHNSQGESDGVLDKEKESVFTVLFIPILLAGEN